MAKKQQSKKSTNPKPIILRKLRPVDVMQKAIKQFVPDEEGGMVELFTVYGKCRNVRAGTSTYGTFHALKGLFQAIRSEDGQEFMSAECFLPEPMHGHIVSAYLSAAENDEDPPMLEFAFTIHLKESKVPVGYEYVTVPIVQPAQTDDLADLRTKALEGPDADAEGVSDAQTDMPFEPDQASA